MIVLAGSHLERIVRVYVDVEVLAGSHLERKVYVDVEVSNTAYNTV
jgi:hypothetical protein